MSEVVSHASTQSRILDAVKANGWYRCTKESEQAAARQLNSKGLVRRHPKDGHVWHDPDLAPPVFNAPVLHVSPPCAHFSAPAPAPAQSDLVASIETARALLSAGDVRAALLLSTGAYEQAKAATTYAEKVKASRELIDKARLMQAEALKIESMCYVAMADTIDEAQAKGRVAKQGRAKVRDADVFTFEEVGIDKRRLHEARKLRDAVRVEPNFVERVVASRLEAGLEPSRRSLAHAIGTRSASAEEKGEQLYETPIEAMRTLLALESFTGIVKEPAVGKGAILRPLEDAGYEVMIADLIDRGISTRHGEAQQVGDFLLSVPGGSVGFDIVTNPPYAELANAFPAHALREHQPRKMALLLNWNFAAGFEDPNRIFVMDENPPSRVYLFTRRLPMMHRDGWDGPKASSQMNTAWFVWERNDDGSYGDGFPRLIRVDWKAYENAAPLLPGAGGNVAPMTFKPQPDEFARETPRKTMDERLDEERDRARAWVRSSGPFNSVMLRQGIAVRPSVADALIDEMAGAGLIVADGDGQWVASGVREAAE